MIHATTVSSLNIYIYISHKERCIIVLLQIYLKTISQNCNIGIAIRIGFALVLAQKCRMKTWILYIPLEIHEHTEESLIACLPGWQLHRTSHSSGMPWCSTRRCTGRMNGKDLIWSCLIRTRFQAFSAQRLCQLHDLNVCVNRISMQLAWGLTRLIASLRGMWQVKLIPNGCDVTLHRRPLPGLQVSMFRKHVVHPNDSNCRYTMFRITRFSTKKI